MGSHRSQGQKTKTKNKKPNTKQNKTKKLLSALGETVKSLYKDIVQPI